MKRSTEPNLPSGGVQLGLRLARDSNSSFSVFPEFCSRNVIYCIRCTACNQLYIGETGRRLGDRFREHLLDVKNNSQDVSKPVARHFNQPGHSHNNMKIFGLSLHQGNTESRKCTEQRLIFKIGTLSPAGINERFSFFRSSVTFYLIF